MALVIIFSIILLIIGLYEKNIHQKNLDTIPLRILVNGIRGKSTVTRLMTGILSAAGYRVVGKTTGTDARILYWHTNEETVIIRRPEGPNIIEQKKVLASAVKLNANAFVSECMAVDPDYQLIFQNQLVQANICVIVNVLEDHMDVMGPTLDDIAKAFTGTIPYGGKLIIAEGPYENYFKKIAEERKTEVFIAKTSSITDKDLKRFSSIYFPENVALAIEFARALNIDEETIWRGMLNANPDPGVVRVHTLEISGKTTYFVNGFAANEATSSFGIWQKIVDFGYPTDNVAVVMNSRADRIDRSYQFARDFLPYFKSDLLISMGMERKPIIDAYNSGKIDTKEFYDSKGADGYKVFKDVEEKLAGMIIFGVGNIHDTADEFMNALLHLESDKCNNIKNSKGDPLCMERKYTMHL